ncbi:MAG: SprT family zinc-dependent metalloprotease [Desulfuromonadaceae bacterium]|nr:SprT family zinc-dependent metalloprotease [Desulfuromonadaceae bacterium]
MHQIIVSGITINVVRKRIKNLHLGVYPPDGRVRVAAPLLVNDEAVRLFVIKKLAWIKRHQAKFAGQERQSVRKCVSGESHYFQGRRYRLNVIHHNGHARIVIRNSTTMDMYVKEGTDADYRKRVLSAWYRQQIKGQIPALIEKWEPIMGVAVAEWGVKQMKTKWGTCSIKARRIWLNLELVKKPVHSLEYIVVHEMAHLLEKHHNDRFKALMDQFLPQWRQYREELNRAPLGWEEWEE